MPASLQASLGRLGLLRTEGCKCLWEAACILRGEGGEVEGECLLLEEEENTIEATSPAFLWEMPAAEATSP